LIIVKTKEKFIIPDAEPDAAGSIPGPLSYEIFSVSKEASGSSRFPQQVVTEGGIEIWIRPVQPDDAALLKRLFESLSPKSIYFRFFSPLRQIPDCTLHRLTHIDTEWEILLVALDRTGKMLGMCCVCILEDRIQAEFAVLIGDPWQGKGIGAELLKRCLILAKERKVERVWGRVLPENTKMLALGKKMGFRLKYFPDDNEIELDIDIRSLQI
jgi:acetyltransferase